ncbi:MAG: hypothetical protein IJJ41_09115 [Clostridia bacterium]|nr:hypothetical protein [Clostridia bacterium]
MKTVKTNFASQIIILCVALLIALPVRVYQYLHVIDPTTGFYISWLQPTVFGLYGLCLLVIVLLIALSFKGRKKTLYAMPSGKKPGLGAASLVFSLSLFAESAVSVYRAFAISSGSLPVQQLVIGDNVGKATLIFTVLQVVFGLLSAVFMMLFAISFFTGNPLYKKAILLSAAPALWGVSRMMIGFSQTISYRYVSELIFDLLMIVFFTMFSVAFAKMCAGVLEHRIQMRLFAYGALASFFAMLCAVPRYVVFLMGRQDVLYRQTNLYEFADLIIPVFVMVAVFSIVATKQYKSVEEYGAESEEQGEAESEAEA